MDSKGSPSNVVAPKLSVNIKKLEIAIFVLIAIIVVTAVYAYPTEIDDAKPTVTESELKQAYERYQKDTDDTDQQKDVVLKYYQFQYDPVTNGEFRYEDFGDQISRDVFLWSLEQSELDYLKKQAKSMFP